MIRKFLLFTIGIFLFVGGAWFVRTKNQTPSLPKIPIFYTKVTKIIDGDSFEIADSKQVRLIGIDAPEYNRCFAEESKKYLANLIEEKEIKLVTDVSETDKYGRLLRYVYVGDDLINNNLVKFGYAKVMTVPPDKKYESDFVTWEKYAKVNSLGLWGKCFQ